MVKKVAHIAIAVSSVEEAAEFYQQHLGLMLFGKETVPHRKVTVGFIEVAGVKIELVQPDADDAPIAKFLREHGPGLHHICFEVSDVEKEFARFKASGVKLVDAMPQFGAAGTKAFFIHPKSTGGVLIELNQPVRDQE
ncbi:MAG: methylmalonyl-CoA epimerase [bacterium]